MEDAITPGRIAAAEVLGYMACANNTPMAVCLALKGPARLQSAFWDGWNARFEEEMD